MMVAVAIVSIVLCVLVIVGMIEPPNQRLRMLTLATCYLLAALAVVSIATSVA